MHWSEKIARELVKKKPDKEEYVVAAGISPSGSVHIGNFRDIATSYFVAKSLQKMGKKVRFIFSWDEYDRFRKVPKNVLALDEKFDRYIGLPYCDIPDPYKCCSSYAEHFEKEFEKSLSAFGISLDFRYQAKEYRSGRYAKNIVETLLQRQKIYDIIMEYKTQEADELEKENYYPVSVYCESCGKDNTKITSITDDCVSAEYVCKCGHHGKINFLKDFNAKLVWKLDWPMRWREEGVDFEPGGKDHAAIGGSYQVSSVLSKEIFGFNPPYFQGYEFIGIKGVAGKMSGSSGLNIVPSTLLKVYEPEMILWLYSKTEPTKAFDFCFDDEILRQYFEYDKMLNAYKDGTASDYIKEIIEPTVIAGRVNETVPMSQLVNFGSIVSFRAAALETLFKRIGLDFTKEQFKQRLELAKFWLENCSPESVVKLLETKNEEYYASLDDNMKKMIRILHDDLSAKDYTLDELNVYLYSIPITVYGEMDEKTKKACQMSFFEAVYTLLIGKTKGPRMYLFLHAIDKNSYLSLL